MIRTCAYTVKHVVNDSINYWNNQLWVTVGVDSVLQAIMKEVDTSGDGKIDKQEFSKYFSG